MQSTTSLLLVVATLPLAACAVPPDPDAYPADGAVDGSVDEPSRETPASPRAPDLAQHPRPSNGPRAPGGVRPEPAPVAAGWTDRGAPALFDSGSGAVIAEAPGGGLGGERDLVVDPWQSRIVVLESDADDPWGEIASYPLVAGNPGVSLGARQHQVWVDGVARLAASPFGAVVFEDGYGPRWRLLRADGQPSASVFGPRPASLLTGMLPDGGFRLSALTYGPLGDALDVRVAAVQQDGVTEPVAVPQPALPLSDPPAARWLESAGGGQVVDAVAGEVVLSTFAGGGWPAMMPIGVGPGIERVEQAAMFPGGNRLALLTSGAANVVIATVGAGGAPECAAALDLPGEPASATLFFSRGLVVVGPGRVLAATSSGVFAVSVSDDCPPVLAVDPAFAGEALRGPLDRLP
jgi:hypothetical protein